MTTKNTKTTKKTAEQALAQDTEISQALATTVDSMTEEKITTNQLLGRIQATTAISGMLEALSLSQLEKVKSEKVYKNLKGQTIVVNGETVDLGTWEGFCKGIGSSKRSIDEKLQNLQLFGEIALENAQNLGMTTRELRKLRKLDPTEQSVIINDLEANIGDKDAIVELIDQMSAKHVKAKEELESQVKNEQAERKATEQIVAKKNTTIDDLQKQLAREETASPFDKAVSYAEDVAKLESSVMQVFGDIDRLFTHIQSVDDLPQVLRVNMGQLLQAVKYHSNELVDKFQLGDISSTDDQLDWIEAMTAAKDGESLGDYVTDGVA